MEDLYINQRNNQLLQLRQQGFPLREIGRRLGISGERVRQILKKSLGSTEHEWLTTKQLSKMNGISTFRLDQLRKQGIVEPTYQMKHGSRSHLLWSFSSVKEVPNYLKTHYLCAVCRRPLPKGRFSYCSDACRLERWKYSNRSLEERQRFISAMRRYREKKAIKNKQGQDLITVC